MNYTSRRGSVWRDRLVGGARRLWTFLLTEGWLWDWLLAAALIAINFSVPGHVVKPFERYTPRHDPGLTFPKVQTWLKGNEKYTLIFALPALIGALAQIRKRSWLDWHNLMLSVFEGLALETSFRKWMSLVGRQRPDWDARLDTGDESVINDGRLSYPSGIAAETFMAFTILSLYLAGKLKLFVRPRPGHFALLLVSLLPVGLATFISVTRMSAYHHHFSDINAGIALGVFAGATTYFLNFPSLFAEDADEPKSRLPNGDRSPRDTLFRADQQARTKGTARFARREDVESGRDQGPGATAAGAAAGGGGGAAGGGQLESLEPDELRVPLVSALAPLTGDTEAPVTVCALPSVGPPVCAAVAPGLSDVGGRVGRRLPEALGAAGPAPAAAGVATPLLGTEIIP